MDYIASVQNPKIKQVGKLISSGKVRKEEGFFVLEGLRLCMDIVRSDMEAEELFLTEEALKKSEEQLLLLQEKSKKTHLISDAVAEKLSDTTHPQGVYCVVRIPEKQVEKQLSSTGKYLLLENVQDPANLGAISRTAEALGITALLVSGGCDIYSPKAMRASMGALLRLPVFLSDNVSELLMAAERLGLKTFASTPNAQATPVTDADFSGGMVCVVGNEANGVTEETMVQCQQRVTIPMLGRAESLNAGAAASILMWEMVKPNETTELLDMAP